MNPEDELFVDSADVDRADDEPWPEPPGDVPDADPIEYQRETGSTPPADGWEPPDHLSPELDARFWADHQLPGAAGPAEIDDAALDFERAAAHDNGELFAWLDEPRAERAASGATEDPWMEELLSFGGDTPELDSDRIAREALRRITGATDQG